MQKLAARERHGTYMTGSVKVLHCMLIRAKITPREPRQNGQRYTMRFRDRTGEASNALEGPRDDHGGDRGQDAEHESTEDREDGELNVA